MNIIGLGNGGCSIADLFSEYPEYKVFKIDVGLKGKNCFKVPASKTIEEYEEKTPKFKKLSTLKGETFFIICGGGNVSGCTLKILEQVKHTEITLLFIKSDSLLASEEISLKEKVIFGILQEYARSGLFKKMVIVSNNQIENLLGGLSVTSYYSNINTVIVSSIQMINYLLTAKTIFGKMSNTREIDRISTIGIYQLEDEQENYFFDLQSTKQKIFLYGIKEKDLTENKELIRIIQQQIKNAYTGTELDISYKITSTNYENNFVYLISNSNFIQQ